MPNRIIMLMAIITLAYTEDVLNLAWAKSMPGASSKGMRWEFNPFFGLIELKTVSNGRLSGIYILNDRGSGVSGTFVLSDQKWIDRESLPDHVESMGIRCRDGMLEELRIREADSYSFILVDGNIKFVTQGEGPNKVNYTIGESGFPIQSEDADGRLSALSYLRKTENVETYEIAPNFLTPNPEYLIINVNDQMKITKIIAKAFMYRFSEIVPAKNWDQRLREKSFISLNKVQADIKPSYGP